MIFISWSNRFNSIYILLSNFNGNFANNIIAPKKKFMKSKQFLISALIVFFFEFGKNGFEDESYPSKQFLKKNYTKQLSKSRSMYEITSFYCAWHRNRAMNQRINNNQKWLRARMYVFDWAYIWVHNFHLILSLTKQIRMYSTCLFR